MKLEFSGRVMLRWWVTPTAAALVALACSGSVATRDTESGTAGAARPTMGSGEAGRSTSGGAQATGGFAQAGRAGFGGSAGAHHIGLATCESPQVDPQTQLVVCANGFSHRAQAGVCSAFSGGQIGAAGAENGGTAGDGAVGSSALVGLEGDCTQDGNCEDGLLCDCSCATTYFGAACYPARTGMCTFEFCKTDADCDVGSFCALGMTGNEFPVFSCLHSEDECLNDSDCPPTPPNSGHPPTICAVDLPSGHRVCELAGI